MSYVNYDQSLYRTGFRPYGQTNPLAATQLSGYPFTESGGWGLRGLGMVPDQSIITYNGTWIPQTTGLQQVGDIVNAVSDQLAAVGLKVRNAASDISWWGTQILGKPFNVTLQIQVANGVGFNVPDDIIADIRHAVYQVTGAMPQRDSIPVVESPDQSAGGSVPQVTGQPPGVTLPFPGSSGTPRQPQDWSTWLQSNFTWIALLVAGVAIVPTLIRRVL